MATPETTVNELTFCEVHPDRETTLRCNKCGRLMCTRCAVQTPVGYRCRECVRGLQDKFYTASQRDYVIIFATTLVLNGVAAFIAGQIGFWFIIIFAAAIVAGAIGEVALRFIQRRRGRYSALIGAAGAAIGGLAPIIYIFLTFGVLFPQFTVLLYAGISTAIIYGRFQMRI